MTLRGLDVSRWNAPHSVPWDEVDFGFVRLTYGLYVDPRAEEHLWNGRKAGKLLGGYHWLDCSPGVWGSEQAELFLKAASDFSAQLSGFDPSFLALAVDVEPADPKWPDPPARVREALSGFLQASARAYPSVAAVYINFAEATRARLGTSAPAFADLGGSLPPLWLADWTPPYEVPAPWERYTILQTGAKGGVDRDVFEGDAEDFRRAFGICPSQ